MPSVGTCVPDDFAPARRRFADRTRTDDNPRPVGSLGPRNHDALACSCAAASPAPDPPPQVTDARVFPNALTLYSSLPLKMPAQGGVLPLYVADGVGINFLSLPDIGATYRQGNAEWRVWPGQALESFIVRRVLPGYPRETNTRGAVSVFVEYLITRDGSVKVLRTSGPAPFTGAAQSAVQSWVYRPLQYENRPCEVISRLEVRFDSEFAWSATSH